MKAPKVLRPDMTVTTNHPWLLWAMILPWRVKFAMLHSRITTTLTLGGKSVAKLRCRVIPKITIVKEGVHI